MDTWYERQFVRDMGRLMRQRTTARLRAAARRRAAAEARRRAARLTSNRMAQLAAAEAAGLAVDFGILQFQNRLKRQPPVVALQNLKSEMVKSKNKILPPITMAGYQRKKIRGAGKYRPYGRGVNPTLPARVATPNTSKGGATNRKNKSNVPKKAPKTIQSQINDLAKKVNVSLSKHTYRYALADELSCNAGECDHEEIYPVSPTLLETYTNNLRFYDPATAALVTADPTTLTASNDIKFKNVHSKLTVKANYLVPAHVKIYLCKLKSDSDIGVLATYSAGLADQCVTAGADTETLLMYLTDIERVTEQFNIDCVADKLLYSGDEVSVSHNTGEFMWDSSHNDTETGYQKQHKFFSWVIRVESVLGHDNTLATQHGRMNTIVDYECVNKAEIHYDAGGTQLNDFSFNDTRTSSFTNTAVTGTRSVPDNITYSRA